MKIVEKAEVFEKLSPAACIAVMRSALTQLEEGRATQYLRTVTKLPSGGLMGYMPAAVEGAFGAKLITIFHSNTGTQYPSHQGSILLFDAQYGSLLASVDGGAVTEIRTGAVSALATDLLAVPGAKHLAILGAGAQGRSHLLAIREVRQLEKVTVWDLDPEKARRFAEEMSKATGLPVTACESAAAAVDGADIICTVTPSHTPILERAWVKPGAHINAVGACAASDRELAGDLVAAAAVYCDNRESVYAEGGDFLIPLKEGLFSDDHLLGTLGELALGRLPGRRDPAQITLFEALGLAVEDIACAQYICSL